MTTVRPRQNGLGRDAAIDPTRTALLVVDAQKGICESEESLANPYFAESIHDRAIPNIASLIQAARTASMEVIYTVIESLTSDGRDRSLDYKLTGFHFPPGSIGAQIVEVLQPARDEIVLPKTSSSLFNSTSFDYLLRNMGLRSVIVTGFQTDQCIDHTVRDGADRGYEMACATDACAAKTAERHDLALSLFSGYCRLATTNILVSEILGFNDSTAS